MLLVLFFVPCLGMCGLFGYSKVEGSRIATEMKAKGERYAAALESTGDAGAPAEHLKYQPLDDGGYLLYFAEPAFGVPTDFFYVWNRGAKRWDLREYSEIPELQ